MNWLNIRTEHLRSPEFIGSDPTARATWFCVSAYSCEQENGGRIIGARSWKCRQWQQTCGVMLKEVMRSDRLLLWDGEDLVVWNYPCGKEHEVQCNRVNGQVGGRAKTQAKTQASALNGANGGRPKNPSGTQAVNPSENPTEGKGMEEEGNGSTPKPPNGATASPSLSVGATDNLPTSQNAQRIAVLFHRKLSTQWSAKEIKAFKTLSDITEDGLDLLEHYYESERKKGANGIYRRDMLTFLNNFTGEMDRAREFSAASKSGRGMFSR